MGKLKEIEKICKNINSESGIPIKAVEIAKDNDILIVISDSNGIVYIDGADCYLRRHKYEWNGVLLDFFNNENIKKESEHLGLVFWWFGVINPDDGKEYLNFKCKVKENIDCVDFLLKSKDGVSFEGKIIKLPKNFKKSI